MLLQWVTIEANAYGFMLIWTWASLYAVVSKWMWGNHHLSGFPSNMSICLYFVIGVACSNMMNGIVNAGYAVKAH